VTPQLEQPLEADTPLGASENKYGLLFSIEQRAAYCGVLILASFDLIRQAIDNGAR
jgi:hypothetical protein